MVQTIDLKQLGAIIEERSQTAIEQMLYRDMFAMACYLLTNKVFLCIWCLLSEVSKV